MRMHVLYDANGRILAAVELPEGAAEDAPQVRPVAKPDQYTADVDMPTNLSFKDACEKLVVDVAQKVPCLKARA
jgi:hypothetical protein